MRKTKILRKMRNKKKTETVFAQFSQDIKALRPSTPMCFLRELFHLQQTQPLKQIIEHQSSTLLLITLKKIVTLSLLLSYAR